MTAPYEVFVRVHGFSAPPIGVACLVTRDGAEKMLRQRVDLRRGQDYRALLLGIRHALTRLADRPVPVVLYTNNTAVAGVLTGTQTAHADGELVAECQRLMGDRTTVVVVVNRASHPLMERAARAAQEAARG